MGKFEINVGQALHCTIGQPRDGYVNIATHFRPLNAIILLLELDASPSVEYVSNAAYYGDSMGGISVKLKEGKTVEHLIEDLQRAIDLDEESAGRIEDTLLSVEKLKHDAERESILVDPEA